MPYRILYHHRTQALDGQRVHINAIQQALKDLGHDVLEVSPVRAIEPAGAASIPTPRRRVLQTLADHTPKGAYELLELGYNVVGYQTLAAAIRRFRPHFIYERYAANTTAGIWVSKRYGVPLLLEVNSPLAQEKAQLGQLMFAGLTQRLERYTVGHATSVLAVTDVLANMLRVSAGLRNGRVVTVHNGVDPATMAPCATQRASMRARLQCGTDAVVIGAVGFFREWHGIDLLLRAVADLRTAERPGRVLLVGEGPAVPALKRLTADLQLEDTVVFTGAIAHPNIGDYLAAMDVVVIPRTVEYASPLKLFEYMAAGKAIIAPRQPNLLEVLSDGQNALCFDPGDGAQLGRVLQRLLADSRLREQLGRAARAAIDLKGLTWAGNASRIIETFERLQQRQRTHAP